MRSEHVMATTSSVHRAAGLISVFLTIIVFSINGAKTSQDHKPVDQIAKLSEEQMETLCLDCRITAQSLDLITRKPRHMDMHGQCSDKVEMEKLKKGVCKDIGDDETRQRCRQFFYTNIRSVENWNLIETKTNFLDHVCIMELKYCCPKGSFGSRCKKCPSCSRNERCHGEGLRVGNGTCVCKPGHSGSDCSLCLPGFYRSQGEASRVSHQDQYNSKLKEHIDEVPSGKHPDQDTNRTICNRCDRSCKQCRHASPLGCEVCNSGFKWAPEYGCLDIDECIESNNKICASRNTFCVNTIGSYFCYECDRACQGCKGDGPDMCLRCAPGYKMEKGNCIATKNLILGEEANYYRYAVYLGLCISACIVLHNNLQLASALGLLVALYIGGSEYFMKTYGPSGDKDLRTLSS